MKDEAYETIQKKLQTFLSSAPRNKDVGITGYVMDMMQHDDSKTAKHIFDALDKETYWLYARDGIWHSESLSTSKGMPNSHSKFLEKELGKIGLKSWSKIQSEGMPRQ